jgi:hypothetical protein
VGWFYRQTAEEGNQGRQPWPSPCTELEPRDKYSASRNDQGRGEVAGHPGLVETRPGQGTFAVQRIQPFVTTLSADPKTGLSGVEGVGWLNEVRAGGRGPEQGAIRLLKAEDIAEGTVAACPSSPSSAPVNGTALKDQYRSG